MAHQDVEIEIKFVLTKTSYLALAKRLIKRAKFLEDSHQIDRYFNAPHRNFLEPEHPLEYLRLRESNGSGSINYKYWYKDSERASTHCDEYESGISNASALKKILTKLNFKEYLTVDKTRKSFDLNSEFEIDLDQVKELGYFVEIETTRDFGSVEKARSAIIKIAKELGVDISKIDKYGYVYLLMQKKKLTK
jgi:adenylate cyclase class 2